MPTLADVQLEWLRLFERMRRGECDGVDPDRIAAPFLPAGLENMPPNASPVLLVGRAHRAPWEKSNEVAETYEFHERLSMTRAHLSKELARPSSAFWRFARDLARPIEVNGTRRHTSIIWSNIAKITAWADGGPNPGEPLLRAQYELAIRSLQVEIATYRPELVIFMTGDWGWAVIWNAFLKDIEGAPEHLPDKDVWSCGKSETYPAVLWMQRPEGEKTSHVESQLAIARDLLASSPSPRDEP